jgi:hypothetical protein
VFLEAESVLQLVSQLDASGSAIVDGASIPLGWSQLTVRARDHRREVSDDLVLCEPRFDGDPRTELRDDITQTLAVLRAQATFVQRIGAASQPTAFDREVTVACGVLHQRRLFAERREATGDHDSGWFIGPRDLPGDVECTTVRVYELLMLRPALLQVLALPVGYLVAFDGDDVETVLDTHDRDLWASS